MAMPQKPKPTPTKSKPAATPQTVPVDIKPKAPSAPHVGNAVCMCGSAEHQVIRILKRSMIAGEIDGQTYASISRTMVSCAGCRRNRVLVSYEA